VPTLSRRLIAEGVGTAFILAAIVGSGIMAEELAAGNTAIALLCNSLATGAMLYALITILAPVSGAHLNPAVTLALLIRGFIGAVDALASLSSLLTAQCLVYNL
jgi:glycerol uptake facilitator-like aquaporin